VSTAFGGTLFQFVHGRLKNIARRAGVREDFRDFDLARRQRCRARRLNQEIIDAFGPNLCALRRYANGQCPRAQENNGIPEFHRLTSDLMPQPKF
jgi:hypothetical protein